MIRANIKQFSSEIRAFVEEDAVEDYRELLQVLALLALIALIQATPVRTGYARSGWYLTAGSPSEEIPPEGSTAPRDPVSQLADVANTSVFVPLWITNNVVYIVRLDDGHSQQAPAGMLAQLPAALRKELA